jgi:Predicted transcriptional regulator
MFFSNVKKLMKDKGLKTVELSERTGLSSATIAKARQDEGISECRLSTLAKIADALGVKTKRLYEEVEG